MPAVSSLRKSSRKSRNGTPSITPHNSNSPPFDSRKEKLQSSLDGWVEPPPKNPAPSFEEHGFARHGVLETMAPLGVPPSAKVKQKARAIAEVSSKRTFFGKNGNLLGGDEGVSTPEMTPAPELDPQDSERQEEEDVPSGFQEKDEDDDDEYVPAKSKGKPQVAKTPVRGKTPVQNKTPGHSKTPSKNGISRPSTAINGPVAQSAPPVSVDAKSVARQKIHIVIKDAVLRSLQNNKQAVGKALQNLHEDSKTDDDLWDVLNSIIHQSSSQEQFAAFRQYIKNAKRRIKMEAKFGEPQGASGKEGSYSPFFPDSPIDRLRGFNTHAKATEVVSPSKSATQAGINEPNPSSAVQSSDSGDLTMEDAPPMPEDSNDTERTTHPLGTVPSLSARRSSSPQPPRMPSKSPRKHRNMNGHTAPTRENDADADLSTKVNTPAIKTPDSPDIVGVSDSDLSDVNEEIVQNGPPEPIPVNGKSTAAATAAKKAKQLAALRLGKKSRANSAKPNGKYEKRAPPSAEELAEEEELRRKREQMVEQQQSRMPYNPPTSDIRFEDEMLETESLTESQIAVGPPINTRPTRRTAQSTQSTRTGLTLSFGKRLREETSSALPSPQLDSAATSRPSTPAVVAPAAKRLKLNNGQAARTKRSPVKNRDGPIAGIAHTGGGGSRQLGPDDNDPGSPPSESDDFCSACKGAGEFVCCDNCTRVFHFLCCDPPLQEPPLGSFLCYECDARLKGSETSAGVESFTLLGPLFKQLESTNTRSFALPSHIRDFYDSVAARDDGSYAEETKKFPLAKSSGYGWQKPDYLRTHDSDQKTILCVQCGKSSAGKRQMLKCDYCHAYWHLDCCDPPLANPPHISLEASQRDAWKCPRHIDHDFKNGLLLQNDLNALGYDVDDAEMVDAAAPTRVARKVRKPKKSSYVEPTFSRGVRNNGLIDIMNDPDDDTDGEGNYVFDDANSKTFRVPEKGVIVDFISKVKQSRIQQQREERRAAKLTARRKQSQQHFAVRPIHQQQAALHLAQLANKESDIGLIGYTVDALILSLTAEAPDEVVDAFANNDPGPMTDAKRAEFLKLRALIDRALQNPAPAS